MAMIEMNHWGEAEQALIRLRKNLPDFAPLSLNLAMISCRLGDRDGILHNLRRASFQGYRDYHRLDKDSCLQPFFNDPAVLAVINLIKNNQEKQRITPGLQKL
jgi:hypothetical protein